LGEESPPDIADDKQVGQKKPEYRKYIAPSPSRWHSILYKFVDFMFNTSSFSLWNIGFDSECGRKQELSLSLSPILLGFGHHKMWKKSFEKSV
jgi:hypothetical protein